MAPPSLGIAPGPTEPSTHHHRASPSGAGHRCRPSTGARISRSRSSPFNLQTVPAVKQVLEALGIGYGKQGATPGQFYTCPGDSVADGMGTPPDDSNPA
jgi:hypothetical protein